VGGPERRALWLERTTAHTETKPSTHPLLTTARQRGGAPECEGNQYYVSKHVALSNCSNCSSSSSNRKHRSWEAPEINWGPWTHLHSTVQYIISGHLNEPFTAAWHMSRPACPLRHATGFVCLCSPAAAYRELSRSSGSETEATLRVCLGLGKLPRLPLER
jgi:hypothetical protein